MKRSERFQFGIRRLLILTTMVGLIIAVVIRIDALSLFRPVVAAYFIFLASWTIMRLPHVYGKFSDLRKRSRQVKKHRRDSEIDVLHAKQAADAETSNHRDIEPPLHSRP